MKIEKLYTLSEAARMLGGELTAHVLAAQIRRGYLPYKQIGRSKLVTLSDLQEMLNRCHVPAAEVVKNSSEYRSGVPSAADRTRAKEACMASLQMLKDNLKKTPKTNGRRNASVRK